MQKDDDVLAFPGKGRPSHEREGSNRSDRDALGAPLRISELKALHPDSEVVEFQKAPRFVVVIRQQIDEEAARQFVSDFASRGVEVAVVCFGNAEARPERCIFGNFLEGM